MYLVYKAPINTCFNFISFFITYVICQICIASIFDLTKRALDTTLTSMADRRCQIFLQFRVFMVLWRRSNNGRPAADTMTMAYKISTFSSLTTYFNGSSIRFPQSDRQRVQTVADFHEWRHCITFREWHV